MLVVARRPRARSVRSEGEIHPETAQNIGPGHRLRAALLPERNNRYGAGRSTLAIAHPVEPQAE
jgi:hypothetical protein